MNNKKWRSKKLKVNRKMHDSVYFTMKEKK